MGDASYFQTIMVNKANRIFFPYLLLLLFNLSAMHTLYGQSDAAMRKSLGKITDSQLAELSGLVASRSHAGMFWTHNDSGDEARIFLLDSTAQLRGTFYLEGIKAIDMEDIAWHTIAGKQYLLLGDIGDNLQKRSSITLYLFEEPEIQDGKVTYTIPASAIRSINLHYPDYPHDAEAFFIDPIDQQLYLITKRDFRAQVYTAAIFDAAPKKSYLLEQIGSLPFTFVTAADISTNAEAVMMKNLTQIFYWKRSEGMDLKTLFKQDYRVLPYQPEPQGEALCFSRSGSHFFTVSERPLGLDSYLYQYLLAPELL